MPDTSNPTPEPEVEVDTLTCDRCREAIPEDGGCGVACTDGPETWCPFCVDNYAVHCENTDCDETMARRNAYYVSGQWFCGSCRSELTICSNCGAILCEGQVYWDDDDDACCEGCLPSEDDVHSYGYRPCPVFHGKPGFVHYGVELECSASYSTAAKTITLLGGSGHVYLKSDSTIVGDGYEVVTHPHTFDAHRELWAKFFANSPTNRGISANDNGLHVHIERKKLSPYRIGLIQAFLNSPANRGLVVAVAGRDSNGWSKLKPDLAKIRREGDGDRYSSLNLTNRDTVEVRIFKGTVKAETFFARLGFVDALVRWSVDRSHTDLDHGSFCKFVRLNRKVYPELDLMLAKAGFLPMLPDVNQRKLSLKKKPGVTACAS